MVGIKGMLAQPLKHLLPAQITCTLPWSSTHFGLQQFKATQLINQAHQPTICCKHTRTHTYLAPNTVCSSAQHAVNGNLGHRGHDIGGGLHICSRLAMGQGVVVGHHSVRPVRSLPGVNGRVTSAEPCKNNS
eukprot:1155607-Pelagomonas_calceolata.AAC.2